MLNKILEFEEYKNIIGDSRHSTHSSVYHNDPECRTLRFLGDKDTPGKELYLSLPSLIFIHRKHGVIYKEPGKPWSEHDLQVYGNDNDEHCYHGELCVYFSERVIETTLDLLIAHGDGNLKFTTLPNVMAGGRVCGMEFEDDPLKMIGDFFCGYFNQYDLDGDEQYDGIIYCNRQFGGLSGWESYTKENPDFARDYTWNNSIAVSLSNKFVNYLRDKNGK